MYHEYEDDRPATMSDAVREWAYNVGDQYPDRAWLLHDYDVWTANPHYRGPKQLHPEELQAMSDAEYEGFEQSGFDVDQYEMRGSVRRGNTPADCEPFEDYVRDQPDESDIPF